MTTRQTLETTADGFRHRSSDTRIHLIEDHQWSGFLALFAIGLRAGFQSQ